MAVGAVAAGLFENHKAPKVFARHPQKPENPQGQELEQGVGGWHAKRNRKKSLSSNTRILTRSASITLRSDSLPPTPTATSVRRPTLTTRIWTPNCNGRARPSIPRSRFRLYLCMCMSALTRSQDRGVGEE